MLEEHTFNLFFRFWANVERFQLTKEVVNQGNKASNQQMSHGMSRSCTKEKHIYLAPTLKGFQHY